MVTSLSLHILVVDDDADTRSNLCDILELDAHRVEVAGSVADVLRRGDWGLLDAIILDRKLPDGTAEELLPRLRRLAPQAAVLIVTGYSDLSGVIAALRQGAADYILKPINADALRASLVRVAERLRLEREQARTKALFRTLIEAAPCMIVIVRPDLSILYFSPFAEELTGYPAAEVIGKDYLQLFVRDPYRAMVAENKRLALTGVRTPAFEYPVVCRDGSQRWMVWHRRRLEDYEGAPAILTVGQDISSVKRAQEQLLQSERLAAIGQMMTGLAHESGNALARSQSCLEMLTWEVEDRPEALELIQGIQKAQEHLKHLYEEVRGYAAPLKLDCEVCEVSTAWRQAWHNLSLVRQGREAVLHEEVDGIDLSCSIDPFRLEQVFRNILENALAACRGPAEIVVHCSEAEIDGRPAVRIAVRDNGPGLSPELRLRIFEPFFTTKTKGTGLGMAIAQRIVEAHGGRPRRPWGRNPCYLATSQFMNPSLRIAVADDEPDMQKYFQKCLPRLGHRVVAVASNGRELVEQCRATSPDLVITDIKMPEMDGIDAANQVYQDRPIPVILVSAFHDTALLRRAEADHVMSYLVKPIKQTDLEPAIVLAVRRFEQFQELRKESADLRQALEDRKFIERAKGILMKRTGLDEQEAFRRLQKTASEQSRKLVEIAHMILLAEKAVQPPEKG